ncbi:hypothetical protein [Glutamicibacter creatinolyticus]|uniref:hypothetical protein n=1 Tax=Glutamicibacter creatinolyticus TaxID=162496 RepID=UPI003217F4D4
MGSNRDQLLAMVNGVAETVAPALEAMRNGLEETADGENVYDLLDVYGHRQRVVHEFVLAGGGPSMDLVVSMSPHDPTEVAEVELVATWYGLEPVTENFYRGSTVWDYAEYLVEGVSL